MEYRDFKVIYRRYASLYFIVGSDSEDEVCYSICAIIFQNELSILEFIHTLVETMDKYFENVVSCFYISLVFFSVSLTLCLD